MYESNKTEYHAFSAEYFSLQQIQLQQTRKKIIISRWVHDFARQFKIFSMRYYNISFLHACQNIGLLNLFILKARSNNNNNNDYDVSFMTQYTYRLIIFITIFSLHKNARCTCYCHMHTQKVLLILWWTSNFHTNFKYCNKYWVCLCMVCVNVPW